MVFKTRPGHLPGIVQILRADEAHHRIYKERLESLGKAVAPGLHGHLVGAVMGVAGKLRALAGLKIHHIRPFGCAVTEQQISCFCDGGSVEAKGGVALFRACDGLKNQVTGRAGAHRFHLRGDMGQHANLRGNLPMLLDLLEAPQNLAHLLRGVGNRIQTDHRVACAEAETLQNGSGDALRVIGGVVGLQTAGQRPRQADGGVAMGGYGDFVCGIDQVKIAHELGNRRHHFRGQTTAYLANVRAAGGLGQDPLPEFGHRPVSDAVVDIFVYVILNDPGDLVLLIGDGGVFPQVTQGQRRQHHLGGDAFLGSLGGKAGQLVAGLFLVGLGQNLFDIPKSIGFPG